MFDVLPDGGRNVGIDRGGKGVLRNESVRCSNIREDFGDHRIPSPSLLTFLSLRSLHLFFLFPLQPCSTELAKFLTTS